MVTVDELVVNISASGVSEYQNQVGKAGQATEGLANSVSRAASSLQGFGSIGNSAMQLQDRLEISNINVMTATDAVFNAQLRYNAALREHGATSQEAIIAGNNLERANNNLTKANKRAEDSFYGMGLTALGLVPHLITLGTTGVAAINGITWSVTGLKVALISFAPYLALAGALVGGLYYVWQKNKVELDENIEGLQKGAQVMTNQTIAAKDLRTEIEKPIARGNLLDIFNENVYQTREGAFGRRTDDEKKTYTAWHQTLGFGAPAQALGISDPGISPDEQYKNALISRGMGWAISGYQMPKNPYPGMPSAPAVGGTAPLQKLEDTMSNIAAAPRNLTIVQNVTVGASDNPFEIGLQLGKGTGQGIDSTKFKPRG